MLFSSYALFISGCSVTDVLKIDKAKEKKSYGWQNAKGLPPAKDFIKEKVIKIDEQTQKKILDEKAWKIKYETIGFFSFEGKRVLKKTPNYKKIKQEDLGGLELID